MSVREKLKKKDKFTTAGGNKAYHLKRNSIVRLPDGSGMPMSIERSNAIDKLGYNPGPNMVFMHDSFGSHSNPKGDSGHWGTRGENSTESNKHRAAVRKKLMKK